jgi:hypothetical protein
LTPPPGTVSAIVVAGIVTDSVMLSTISPARLMT